MQLSLGEQWLNMQGSTKHSICWSFGHDVRLHKCEGNNEVIRFAEQKKWNKGKSTLKEQYGKIIWGKKLIGIVWVDIR